MPGFLINWGDCKYLLCNDKTTDLMVMKIDIASNSWINIATMIRQDSAYITDEELYKKIELLLDNDNHELVDQLYKTIKNEYENKELRRSRLGVIAAITK